MRRCVVRCCRSRTTSNAVVVPTQNNRSSCIDGRLTSAWNCYMYSFVRRSQRYSQIGSSVLSCRGARCDAGAASSKAKSSGTSSSSPASIRSTGRSVNKPNTKRMSDNFISIDMNDVAGCLSPDERSAFAQQSNAATRKVAAQNPRRTKTRRRVRHLCRSRSDHRQAFTYTSDEKPLSISYQTSAAP